MQSYRQVALPAMTPGLSVRVARGPGDGDGLAAQAVLAVGQAAGHHAVGDQDDVIIPKGAEGEPHMAGWMWTPSVISSTSAPRSRAAMMGPGARWVMPGMGVVEMGHVGGAASKAWMAVS